MPGARQEAYAVPMAIDTQAAPAPLPLRILMVEDNANDAELLHAYLADAVRDGAELLHARSPAGDR